jgi:hypothetical protein
MIKSGHGKETRKFLAAAKQTMRTFQVIIFILLIPIILVLIFHIPSCAYYKWYDENGIVHYTEAPPPKNARDKDGTSWWEKEQDQEGDMPIRESGSEKMHTPIENKNAHEFKREANSAAEIEANSSLYTDEASEQDFEDAEKKGFFRRFIGFFSRKQKKEKARKIKEETKEEERSCEEPWLIEKHGICALNNPDMDIIGNSFKAEVVDHRKGVWSSCRGTVNGDVLTFTYKGEGYWETDGNVPQCAFYQGFYWK